jgi:hypothetical protein
MKKICPIRFDRSCLTRDCAWYDSLDERCMVVTVGAQLFNLKILISSISDTYSKIISPEKEFIKED